MLKHALIRVTCAVSLLLMLIGGEFGLARAQEGIAFSTPEGERAFSLSPDGSMIATADRRGARLCIYTIPAAEVVRCVDLDEFEVRVDPVSISWSPSSEAIVFSEPATFLLIDSDIMHLDIATGELTYLTDDGFADRLPVSEDEQFEPFPVDVMPAWSPDGSTIAFSRTIWSPDPFLTSSLMLLNVESNEVTELSLFADDAPFALPWRMLWSPDGSAIVASAWFAANSAERSGVWQFETVSGAFTQLLGPSEALNWAAPAVVAMSSSGEHLILGYPEYLDTTSSPRPHSGYVLYSLTDGSVAPLEPSDAYSDDAALISPNFSPNGSSLIFGVNQELRGGGLLVVRNIASGEETLLAELPDNEQPVAFDWSIPIQVGGSTLFVPTGPSSGYVFTLPAELSAPNDAGSVATAHNPSPEASVVASPGASAAVGTVQVAEYAAVLRAEPEPDADIVAIVPPGANLLVLGEPFESDDHFWIEVTVDDTGETGFVRTDFLEPVG